MATGSMATARSCADRGQWSSAAPRCWAIEGKNRELEARSYGLTGYFLRWQRLSVPAGRAQFEELQRMEVTAPCRALRSWEGKGPQEQASLL